MQQLLHENAHGGSRVLQLLLRNLESFPVPIPILIAKSVTNYFNLIDRNTLPTRSTQIKIASAQQPGHRTQCGLLFLRLLKRCYYAVIMLRICLTRWYSSCYKISFYLILFWRTAVATKTKRISHGIGQTQILNIEVEEHHI